MPAPRPTIPTAVDDVLAIAGSSVRNLIAVFVAVGTKPSRNLNVADMRLRILFGTALGLKVQKRETGVVRAFRE